MNINSLFLSSFSILIMIGSTFSTKPKSSAELKLPEEQDNFQKLRQQKKVYVDKTHYITKLLTCEDKYFRMCRPRKFGKSNFVNMLSQFFQSKENLFSGLAIHDNHENWQPFPLIHLDFTLLNTTNATAFENSLMKTLKKIGRSQGIKINETKGDKQKYYRRFSSTQIVESGDLIRALIQQLSDKATPFKSIVILIDEYDWPVRHHVENGNHKEAENMRIYLDGLFSSIEWMHYLIRFMFMTCTTPLKFYEAFKQHGISDLTHNAEYAEMIGFTDIELVNHFKPHITSLMKESNHTFEEMVQKLRENYDGYCFTTAKCNRTTPGGFYDFHSVIESLRRKKIDNFWSPSQNPQFNVFDIYSSDKNRHKSLKSFSNFTIPRSSFNDITQKAPLTACMVLYGYLTFRDFDQETDEYLVDFPNNNVRDHFIRELMGPVATTKNMTVEDIEKNCVAIKQSLFDNKCENFIKILNDLAFGTEGNTCGDENACIDRWMRIFQLCNIKYHYQREYYYGGFTAGTVDMAIDEHEACGYLYIFEFTWNETASCAFEKLLKTVELRSFQNTFNDRRLYLTAINFGTNGTADNEWIKVTFENGAFSNLSSSGVHLVKAYESLSKKNIMIPARI